MTLASGGNNEQCVNCLFSLLSREKFEEFRSDLCHLRPHHSPAVPLTWVECKVVLVVLFSSVVIGRIIWLHLRVQPEGDGGRMGRIINEQLAGKIYSYSLRT